MIRGETRERCPKCRLSAIFQRHDGTYRCQGCRTVFLTPVVGTKVEKVEPKSGVAGRVLIGRGMSGWGAES